jgi:predicted dehydrogenase
MNTPNTESRWSRRQFVTGTLAAVAASSLQSRAAQTTAPADLKRKIKLGVIGNGGRGAWIANLFRNHGGFQMHAVADYFQDAADRCGDALGVDKARRFSTLSGYRRLMESGVEAVALETPPYFLPEHAHAAVEAGLHVYMAKPVAVDAPGCLQVLAAARTASQKQRCFLVDYQMPTDHGNIEVIKRLRDASFGPIVQIASVGIGSGFADPEKTATIESRLQHLVWVNDVALGCDYIGNFDIHAIDAALWAAGQRPVAAAGGSRVCRANPHGDSRDVCSVVFEYAGGLVHNHFGQALPNQTKSALDCSIYSRSGNATLSYWGTAQWRSADDTYSNKVENLYETGAARNIAAFYRNIITGDFENGTVQRAVDGALACILGREAAAGRVRLTMDQLVRTNRKLEVDLKGLRT